jgi:hypothetical protein
MLRPSRVRPVVDLLYAQGEGRFEAEATPDEVAHEEERVLVASPARPQPAAPSLSTRKVDPLEHHRERNPAETVQSPRAEAQALEDVVPAALFDGAHQLTNPVAEAPAVRKRADRGLVEIRAEPRIPLGVEHVQIMREPAVWAGRDLKIGPPRRSTQEREQTARPEEVHINIGRVEVIAAPPPSPRAPPPAHKATSLEDYLRGVSARRR